MTEFLKTTVDKFIFKVATDRNTAVKDCGRWRRAIVSALDYRTSCSSAAAMWPLPRSNQWTRYWLLAKKWQ